MSIIYLAWIIRLINNNWSFIISDNIFLNIRFKFTIDYWFAKLWFFCYKFRLKCAFFIYTGWVNFFLSILSLKSIFIKPVKLLVFYICTWSIRFWVLIGTISNILHLLIYRFIWWLNYNLTLFLNHSLWFLVNLRFIIKLFLLVDLQIQSLLFYLLLNLLSILN